MCKRNALRVVMTVAVLCLILVAGGDPAAAVQNKSGKTSAKSKGKSMTTTNDAAKESPFACNVAGISAEQRPRYMALASKLVGSKQEVRELPDGYAFKFSAEASTIQDLGEFIAFERLCCPFFDLELMVEREGGPAWLRLRGRQGVKEFICAEFGLQ